MECVAAEARVVAPDLTFTPVLAIAPVAGNPPNNEETEDAIPCPKSSRLGWYGLKVTLLCAMPSANLADNRDSIAASSAISIIGIIKDKKETLL